MSFLPDRALAGSIPVDVTHKVMLQHVDYLLGHLLFFRVILLPFGIKFLLAGVAGDKFHLDDALALRCHRLIESVDLHLKALVFVVRDSYRFIKEHD